MSYPKDAEHGFGHAMIMITKYKKLEEQVEVNGKMQDVWVKDGYYIIDNNVGTNVSILPTDTPLKGVNTN